MKDKFSQKVLELAPSTTLEITGRAAELRKAGADLVSFGTGEPDFDTPDPIKEAAIEALKSGFTKYTASSGIVELRAKIAAKLKTDNGLDYRPNQIIVTNGGKQALYNALQAILNPGEEVILLAPYWLSYPEMVKMAGGKVVVLATRRQDHYLPKIDDLQALIGPHTKAIILNSPCNPTGAVYSRDLLAEIAQVAISHDLWVISDEIYEKLIYNGKKHISIGSLGGEIFRRTIVVNGFSKAYAMTGWRLGYAAASQDLIGLMTRLQSHQTSNINSISQKAGLAALEDIDISHMVAAFDKRRQFMVNYLRQIPGIHFIEPDGAFYVLLDMNDFLKAKGISARQMARDLLEEKHVALVPADDFGVEGHIRLSYPIEIDRIKLGLDRLQAYMAGK